MAAALVLGEVRAERLAQAVPMARAARMVQAAALMAVGGFPGVADEVVKCM